MRLNRFTSLCGLIVSAFIIGCGGGGNSTPPQPTTLTISTSATLTAGTVGTAYTLTLAASGGTAPYTWSISAGTLPAGLALSSSGVLSGTPTTAGASTFTIQAKDSAATAQTATLAASLTINPPAQLAITTTSPLPTGTVGTAYSGATFAATGGISPYTWSIPAGSIVPPGLTLNSAGVLSGTPTSPVSSITVQVSDSETPAQTVSQSFVLIINPATASSPIPDGTYAFIFAGTSPQGSPATANAINLNGTFKLQAGNVVSGFYDQNTNSTTSSSQVLAEQPITGGSLVNYTDGLGTLVLNTSATTSITFSLAIPVAGKDIRIVEFDDTTGSGTRGSGILKAATATPSLPIAAAGIAFLVSTSNSSMQQEALICSFQVDNTGVNIVSLKADTNKITSTGRVTTTFNDGITPGVSYGSLTMDANGRGLLTFKLGTIATFHFSFYEVSATQWFLNSADPVTVGSVNNPLASGSAYQQVGPFSTASFPPTSVVEVSGLAPSTSSATIPDISLGLATNAGGGVIDFLYDEYKGSLSAAQTHSVTYGVDPVSGRAADPADTTNSQPVIYLIDSSTSFILFPGDSANSGLLEEQTGTPFTNASFSGSYLGGSLALSNTTVLNEAGLVTADGNGNLTLLTNQSTPSGLVQYVSVTGTYAVDSTGRVVVTAADGTTRIFYVVSPGKIAYLSGQDGGYLGSFEQ